MLSRKNIPFEKSFASCDKAKYWHYEKNIDVKPNDITIRTATKYWFICNNPECGHKFLTSPDKIASGNWCVYCGNNKICDDESCKKCFEKSFASHEKAIYWNLEKNGITPNKVNKYSNHKFWFNCPCGHIFDSFLGSITKGFFCAYCAGKKLCDNTDCQKCYNSSFASHEKAQYWNYEKNGEITPRSLFKYCNSKCYFTCAECSHIFDVSLCNIRLGRWCPYCGLNKLCNDADCMICFNNSFASQEKSKMWSVKNGDLTPRMVARCSGKKYWFKCTDCTHEFEMAINHIVRRENTEKSCPICSSQYLCDNDDCKICFEKSFASSPFACNLNKDKNTGINLRNIFKSGGQTLFFDCQCGHIVESKPANIDNKIPCAYCYSLKLCDKEDCYRCFNNSFASNPFVKYLVDKDVNPRMITKGSKNKYNFTCEKNHKFLKQISLITSQSLGCPKCINKTERIVYEQLIEKYETLIFQYKPDWSKNEDTNCYLPFDFALEEHKIIIELDGIQHFKQVKNWMNPEETRKRDKIKMQKANENSFSVIRILQTDVLANKYEWLSELQRNIDKIINEGKVQNIYICKNNEYDIFTK
jgi:hypothetical protein